MHRHLRRPHFDGLWRHPDFMKLWAGQTISLFGSQVTILALPLTAVVLLGASPAQMGLLAAFQFVPYLLFGLVAGVWVDRIRRRPVLIAADFGRALLIGSIPIAALADMLRIEHLIVVGFLNGVLTVFFDVAYQSYLPALVGREHLVEGNSRLETSNALAQITGPGLTGALVQLTTAPFALAADAVSFLASALSLGMIGTHESATSRGQERDLRREIAEGLRVVLRHPVLRSIALCTATLNLFTTMLFSVYVLYLVRSLHLAPAVLGVMFAIASGGGLLGAMLARKAQARFGVGRTIVGAALLGGLGTLAMPLAGAVARLSLVLGVPLLVAGEGLFRTAVPVYIINQVSLRQAITPDRLRGRVNATMRFLVAGMMPLGALAGGLLGESLGLWTALLLSSLGMMSAFLWVVRSPLAVLRDPADAAPVAVPEIAAEPEPAGAAMPA